MSIALENYFAISLDVLSYVLYGWRSLEATVRIRLKARGEGLTPKLENIRELLIPVNINRQEDHTKSSIPNQAPPKSQKVTEEDTQC